MSSSTNKHQRLTASIGDTINRAFILAQKCREHLESLSTDASAQTFTTNELAACGHKRKQNDSLIDQTKILECDLNELLRNPKYVSVSVLKDARRRLLTAGVCMANPPKIESDVKDEDDNKNDKNEEDTKATITTVTTANAGAAGIELGSDDDDNGDDDGESIDGDDSDDDVKSGDESYEDADDSDNSDDSDDSDDSNEYEPSDASSDEDGDKIRD